MSRCDNNRITPDINQPKLKPFNTNSKHDHQKIIVTNAITAETMPTISPTANSNDDPTAFVGVDVEDGPF
jgi:hypothetical protein